MPSLPAPPSPPAAVRLLRLRKWRRRPGSRRARSLLRGARAPATGGPLPGCLRLYDASDLERLRVIRGLRVDAGFSLAEIRLLLEDEEARIRDGERFRASGDVDERRAILRDLISRVDRQVARLEEKAERIVAMIDVADARRAHFRAHLAELEGGPPAHDEGAPHPVTGP